MDTRHTDIDKVTLSPKLPREYSLTISQPKNLTMPSNTSNSAQNSETSSPQHPQASTPSHASVIKTLQTISDEQCSKNRLRDMDYFRSSDNDAVPSKAHDTLYRHYWTEIAHLRKRSRPSKTPASKSSKPSSRQRSAKSKPSHNTMETPAEQVEAPIVPDSKVSDPEELYCYCLRPSSGPMVACDNPSCSRKRFHLHHTNLPSLPSASSTWICTRCRGWEALYDRGCWRCPKCFYEVLDEDADYDEGVPAKHAPGGCEGCGLERGDAWQRSEYGSESSGGEEEEGVGDGDGESGSGEEVGDDGIEYDVDSEDAEMGYDDVEDED